MEEFTGTVTGPALLFVNVSWCGHCKRAQPAMGQVAEAMGAAVPVISVDGDRHQAFVRERLGVESFPTILYLDAAGNTAKFEGERTPQQIMDFVCQHSSTPHGFCRRRQ
jgi:thioredoxin-like negative regulator of GroEL